MDRRKLEDIKKDEGIGKEGWKIKKIKKMKV